MDTKVLTKRLVLGGAVVGATAGAAMLGPMAPMALAFLGPLLGLIPEEVKTSVASQLSSLFVNMGSTLWSDKDKAIHEEHERKINHHLARAILKAVQRGLEQAQGASLSKPSWIRWCDETAKDPKKLEGFFSHLTDQTSGDWAEKAVQSVYDPSAWQDLIWLPLRASLVESASWYVKEGELEDIKLELLESFRTAFMDVLLEDPNAQTKFLDNCQLLQLEKLNELLSRPLASGGVNLTDDQIRLLAQQIQLQIVLPEATSSASLGEDQVKELKAALSEAKEVFEGLKQGLTSGAPAAHKGFTRLLSGLNLTDEDLQLHSEVQSLVTKYSLSQVICSTNSRLKELSLCVGREDERQAALEFASKGQGIQLWTAKAGEGKSAFLASLLKPMQDKGLVLRHFFRENDSQLSDVHICLKHLIGQLLSQSLASRKVAGPSLDPSEAHNVLFGALSEAAKGQRIIILLDALDEARAGDLRLLCPSHGLPGNVIIIATVRAGDNDQPAPLPFSGYDRKLLPRLAKIGDLREWVTLAGDGELAPWADEIAKVLEQTTKGFALHVRLVVQDLLERLEKDRSTARQELVRRYLEALPEDGFDGYVRDRFKSWDLEKLEGHEKVLYACLAFPGRVTLMDLRQAGLLRSAAIKLKWEVRRWLDVWSSDAGDSFAFSHPAIRDAFNRIPELAFEVGEARKQLAEWALSHWKTSSNACRWVLEICRDCEELREEAARLALTWQYADHRVQTLGLGGLLSEMKRLGACLPVGDLTKELKRQARWLEEHSVLIVGAPGLFLAQIYNKGVGISWRVSLAEEDLPRPVFVEDQPQPWQPKSAALIGRRVEEWCHCVAEFGHDIISSHDDGSILVWCHTDGMWNPEEVKLWGDICTGLLQVGREFVSAFESGTLSVWGKAGNQWDETELASDRSWCTRLIPIEDGFAASHADGSITMWERVGASWSLVRETDPDLDCSDITAYNDCFISVHSDGTILLWRREGDKWISEFVETQSTGCSWAVTVDGILLTRDHKGSHFQWSNNMGKWVSIEIEIGAESGSELVSAGKSLCSSAGRELLNWRNSSGYWEKEVLGTCTSNCRCISKYGETFITGHDDGAVHLWNWKGNLTVVGPSEATRFEVNSLAGFQEGLLSGHADGGIWFWTLDNGRWSTEKIGTGVYPCNSIAAFDKHFATAHDQKSVSSWHSGDFGWVSSILSAEANRTVCVAPFGQDLASLTDNGFMHVVDIDGTEVVSKKISGYWIPCMTSAKDGLAIGSDSGEITIWMISEGVIRRKDCIKCPYPCYALCSTPDDLISTHPGGSVYLWYLRNGEWNAVIIAGFFDAVSCICCIQNESEQILAIGHGRSITFGKLLSPMLE